MQKMSKIPLLLWKDLGQNFRLAEVLWSLNVWNNLSFYQPYLSIYRELVLCSKLYYRIIFPGENKIKIHSSLLLLWHCLFIIPLIRNVVLYSLSMSNNFRTFVCLLGVAFEPFSNDTFLYNSWMTAVTI